MHREESLVQGSRLLLKEPIITVAPAVLPGQHHSIMSDLQSRCSSADEMYSTAVERWLLPHMRNRNTI
ncbi:MAG: hypothetical protein EBZ48_14165 [Proteobacteria bacterium]|nr:hypothetical protein [Pseudomonadota bacterium]